MRLLAYLFDLFVLVVMARLLGMILNRLFGKPQAFRWSPSAHGRGAPSEAAAETRQGETVRDPVCGMFVSTELSHQLKQDGQTLHFCSLECKDRYLKDPLHV